MTITIYVADIYGSGCPSNQAPKQIGVGRTPGAAIAAAEPWANQAPWFRERARRVLVSDGAPLSPRDEHAVWSVLQYAYAVAPDELATALNAVLPKDDL